MSVLQITPDLVTAIGAKDAEDFAAKLPTVLLSVAGLEDRIKALESAHGVDITGLQAALTETQTKVNGFEAKITSLPDEAKVKQLAQDAGSLAAANALGKAGMNAVAPAPEAEPVAADKSKELEAAGDYAGAWKASAQLQKEFASPETYENYTKAVAKGMVKLKSK